VKGIRRGSLEMADMSTCCHYVAVPQNGRAVALAALLVAIGMAACALTILAARADVDTFRDQRSSTVMDVAVGIAFLIAAIAARGALPERLLFSAVGLAWLAGSSFGWAQVLHQAVLLVALLAFPSGRLRGPARWAIAAVAVAVAGDRMPQLGVVALFAAASVVVVVDRREFAAAAYPAVAGVAVSGAVWYSWWNLHQLDEAMHPMVYQIVLLAVACGFPVASRALIRYRRRLTDRILGEQPPGGLSGLQVLLGRVLGDGRLAIDVWDASLSEFRHVAGQAHDAGRPRRDLFAYDGEQLLARMSTTSSAISDRPTAEATVSILRLAAVNQRLHEAQAERLTELEATRTRLLAAADLERARIARDLQSTVLEALQVVAAALADVAATGGGDEVGGFLAVAVDELSEVRVDVQHLVDGVPPVLLGGGRIVEAIKAISMRSAGSVGLSAVGDVAGGPVAEAALFYACSEALVNAAKHSGSGSVDVDVRRVGDRLLLTVRDRGRGGADVSGSGLQGLADRLAAAGGRLTVDSPAGGGTTVTADVPA
jgi:signal transduction histidine kinase